jgi:flagellar motor switch/type III secretory pathway protein FliN
MTAAAAQALSPIPAEKPPTKSESEELRWRPALELSCQLTVDLPVPGFKVSDFLTLRLGAVLESDWRLTRDIPLRINGTLIGWAEFEGSGNRLAVRLMELA